ncbi:hypothetical protein IE337_01695 [Weissella viridescens]|uniref:hypothetical protein n=1 Tax=Weissella viridescens TaxID=1629 RepID=UPI001747BBA6|nr:hypothetical protein [Weissella viridescens]QOD86354.1 hypothetical protein IE337_01695 [Weissella viridescens]WJI91482.1 hypothetical protein PWA48_01675 [Weissella viridescens]
MFSIFEHFHNNQYDLGRQTNIVEPTAISRMSDFILDIPIGSNLKNLSLEDVAWRGRVEGQNVLIDFKEGKIEVNQFRNIAVEFPNGERFDGMFVEKSENNTVLKVGDFIAFEFKFDQNSFNVIFKPDFEHSERDEMFLKVKALESFVESLYVNIYEGENLIRIDLPFEFDQITLNTLYGNINYLKRAQWLKEILGIDFLANLKELDQESKKNIDLLMKMYLDGDKEVPTLGNIFSVKIKETYFILTCDDNKVIKSVFDRKNSFFSNKNFVLTSALKHNETYAGNLFTLIDDNIWQIPDYKIDWVLSEFDKDKVVPDWYGELVNDLGLEYIRAYDVTEDEKWLKGAKKIFDLPFLNQSLTNMINKIQVDVRLNCVSPISIKKLIDLNQENDDNDLEKQLCVAIILDDVNWVSAIWNKLADKEMEKFKKFPIVRIANEKIRNVFGLRDCI